MKEKDPLVLTVVVPKTEESIKRVTLELGSPVPIIVGVESFVRGDETISGVLGLIVSIVTKRAEDSVEVLPAVSTAVTVRE